ncbi:hypothetical protein BVG16_10695 [Paenibacillus selenitireducens]|uniref:HTH araC/xylS-type domain-containing protein n=2 Tax=Paenibacillus selenitireducens TaxID=1324314 RepID=A0A1T2XFY0_9BACL|nr:hypothetical protein BVG16_10695 [Paenibacillus selenitireducens]
MNVHNRFNSVYWQQHLANVQLDLSIAAYTKVPEDWHDTNYIPEFNKLYYIVEGEGFVQVGEERHVSQPGQLILLPAGTLQSYGTIPDAPTFGKYWCHFSAKVGNQHLFDLLRTPLFVNVDEDDELRKQFDRLIRFQYAEGLSAAFRVRSALLEIISMFLDQSPRIQVNTSKSPSFEKMSRVIRHIEDHLSSTFSIEELARIVHLQPNYFIQTFKQVTGQSPIQYINRLRLEKAAQLLNFTNLGITEIAETVGIELSYFSRMFKEYTGYSPSAYREYMLNSQTGPMQK